MKSVDDNTIVGVGEDPEKALREAEAKGFKNPVLLYIPEKDLVHIYPVVDKILCNTRVYSKEHVEKRIEIDVLRG